MNYYPFHIGDYTAHTARLSLMEDLAYRRLIDAYYLAERPFNCSASDVAREIGMLDQLASVEYVLSKFFQRTEDGFSNDRCEREVALFRDKQAKASAAGKASAERRRNTKPTDVGKAATGVQPTNNQEPITNTEGKPSVARATRKCPESFVVTAELGAWAVAECPLVNIDLETAKLRDHTYKTARSDWAGTWRNWMRSAQQDAQARGPRFVPAANRQQAIEERNKSVARAWAAGSQEGVINA